jgi:3-hydroxyisobutyrate dehydrogenase-like beta-hydroxyacid dehydrogenase
VCGVFRTAAKAKTSDRLEPAILAYLVLAARWALGAGQHTRMVNLICIAAPVQALSEGLVSRAARLDRQLVADVILNGADRRVRWTTDTKQ